MKKLGKKLHLNRETVRSLEAGQLENIAAGIDRSEVLTSCNGCNTRNTCGSRLC
jgi:hypothetical protein